MTERKIGGRIGTERTEKILAKREETKPNARLAGMKTVEKGG